MAGGAGEPLLAEALSERLPVRALDVARTGFLWRPGSSVGRAHD